MPEELASYFAEAHQIYGPINNRLNKLQSEISLHRET